jgi:phosphate-selective porin OprO/OprP
MERQMAIDVIPILADGVKWLGYLPESGIFWNAGAYIDWFSKSQSFSTYRWQLALRTGWIPIYSEVSNTVLHIALNYRYGKVAGTEIRLRSRPEVNPAPYFIDTENFPAHHSNHFGGELYFSSGSWMFGTEYYAHQFSSPQTSNPLFLGGEMVLSYIFNSIRPYSTISGIYTFVPAANSVFDGGTGTWEALIRVSYLDLDDGALTGGTFWRLTPMVNWYLSKNLRLEVAYGYGILKRFNLEGVTQFFQSRIQLSF